MSDMPERIWLDWPGANHGEPIYTEPPERDTQAGQTEYVRADIVQALTAERDKYEGAWMTAEGRLADAEAERDKALAANRGLVRLNEVTEAHAQRLREAGNAAAMELRVIAGMDLMGASATAWNAACKLEAALKGETP